MNFKTITQEKYLRYFLSNIEHSITDVTMTDFLNDMIRVSESADTPVPPTEIIKEIIAKCGLEGATYDCITQIASSDLLNTLTAIDTFTLLWFLSCKNSFTYQEDIYLRYANNGVIGKLLKKLA